MIYFLAFLMSLNAYAYPPLQPEHPQFHPAFAFEKQFYIAGILIGGESDHPMKHAEALSYCNALGARVPSEDDLRRFFHFFELITGRNYSRKEFSFKRHRTYWTSTRMENTEIHRVWDPNVIAVYSFFSADIGAVGGLYDLDQEHYALCMIGE